MKLCPCGQLPTIEHYESEQRTYARCVCGQTGPAWHWGPVMDLDRARIEAEFLWNASVFLRV